MAYITLAGGILQDQTIYDIPAEQKPNQQEQYKFNR